MTAVGVVFRDLRRVGDRCLDAGQCRLEMAAQHLRCRQRPQQAGSSKAFGRIPQQRGRLVDAPAPHQQLAQDCDLILTCHRYGSAIKVIGRHVRLVRREQQ